MSAELVPLEDGEEVVTDADETYFRVCPGHLQDREPSALMFKESSADAGALSGARSSKTTAQATFDWHAASAQRRSKNRPIATFGLTVAQIAEVSTHAQVPLRVVDDGAVRDPQSTPPGHAILDQRHLGDNPSHPDKRRLRALLYQEAMRNGKLWPLDPEPGA